MKNINQFLKKLFTIEHLVHGVMILFAGASLANVATFFADAGHATVGWALGLALGSALVSVSIMATKIDRPAEPATFKIVAASVLMLALLSGAIQSRAYSLHLPIMWAIMLGFGLPVCGEALLAFACAEYSQAQRRKRIRRATDGTEERIAEAISEALSDVDVTSVKKKVQKQVDAIVTYKVGEVAASMMGGNAATIDNFAHASANYSQSMRSTKAKVSTAEMREVKAQHRDERRKDVLDQVAGQEVKTFVTQMCNATGKSRDTIYRDLHHLQDSGQIILNGSVSKVESYEPA